MHEARPPQIPPSSSADAASAVAGEGSAGANANGGRNDANAGQNKCANGDAAVRIRARVGSIGFDRARADDGGHRGDVARECGGGFSRDLPGELLVASRGGGTHGRCAAFAMPLYLGARTMRRWRPQGVGFRLRSPGADVGGTQLMSIDRAGEMAGTYPSLGLHTMYTPCNICAGPLHIRTARASESVAGHIRRAQVRRGSRDGLRLSTLV